MPKNITSYKDLIVWQKSMDLVKVIYKLTATLPPHERFGLAGQLQRAAVSIPSNIAEGSKRSSRADFRQFCLIALGSAAEIETQMMLVSNLCPEPSIQKVLMETSGIQKMLNKLTSRLQKPL